MDECKDCKWFYPLDVHEQELAICLKGDTQYKQIIWHNCDACEEYEKKGVNDGY